MSRSRFFAAEGDQYFVRRLCPVLGVSCTGYYQLRSRVQPTSVSWQVAA